MQSWHSILAVTTVLGCFIGSCSSSYPGQNGNWQQGAQNWGPNGNRQQQGAPAPNNSGYNMYGQAQPPQAPVAPQQPYGDYNPNLAAYPQPMYGGQPPQGYQDAVYDMDTVLNELPFHDMQKYQKLNILSLQMYLDAYKDAAKFVYLVIDDIKKKISSIGASAQASTVVSALQLYMHACLTDGMNLPEDVGEWEAKRQVSQKAATAVPTGQVQYRPSN